MACALSLSFAGFGIVDRESVFLTAKLVLTKGTNSAYRSTSRTARQNRVAVHSRNVATAITSFAAQVLSSDARIHTTIPSLVSCIFSKGSPPSASTRSVFARRVERGTHAPRSRIGHPEDPSRSLQRGHRRDRYLLRIAPLTSTDPAEVAGGISRGAEDAMVATGAPSSVRARATRLASGLPKETRFVPLFSKRPPVRGL
jgi:hypothetical protein